MDFFDQPRYRINKALLRTIGLWPYQKKGGFFLGLSIFCSLSLISTQIRKTIIDSDNPETIMEAIPPFIVDIMCVIKVSNSILNLGKMRQILKRIREDIETPMGPESKILHQFADEGRTYTIVYAICIYSVSFFFAQLPAVPRIIVALGLANVSAPARFAFPVDYIVDPEDNYFYIQTHLCIGVMMIATMIVSIDGMFVVSVQHGCGIFSAIGCRLENLANNENLDFELHPDRRTDETFWIVIDCIKKHKSAIQFARLIDSTYSWSFFLSLGLNMAILSFSGFQAALSLANNELEQLLIQIIFVGGQVMHLFFESYFSQRLTDHSWRVYEALNQIRWYKMSLRTRKLLNFMLMRSSIPIELKAGKIYTMSMKNFSSVVRTSMSYFTLLCSLR